MTVQVKQAYIKWLGLLIMIMLVVVITVAWVTQRNSHNTEDLTDSVNTLEESVDEIKRSTRHLEEFVEQLEVNSPEEQERNDAITRAVNEVPRIKAILCEAFPEASACRQEDGT